MGWASGFRAGSDIAQRIIDGREKRQLKEGLSRAADQYRVTEGEYGPQLSDNVTQVQGLKQQAIQGGMTPEMAAQQYDPSIAELQRRQGLTAPDFSVGSRGINYGTRQEASAVAQPQVMQAQAQAYESMGQPEKAASLRADAQRMEAATQQMKLTGLQTKAVELENAAAERKNAAAKGRTTANQVLLDYAKTGQPVTTQVMRDVARQTGANFNDLVDDAAKELGFSDAQGTAELKKLQRNLGTAAAGGVQGMNKFLADSFDPNKNDNITPEVVKDGSGNFVVKYGDKVLSEYGAHKSLDFLVGTLQGQISGDPLGTLQTLAGIRESEAAAAASQAAVGLRGAQADAIRNAGENATALAGIQTEFDALTPEQKVGPEGQALIQQFNMLNVKAGGTVAMGRGGSGGEKQVTPKEKLDMVTAYVGMGLTLEQARMQVDSDLGVTPASPVDDALAAKNAAAAAAATKPPPRDRGPQDISPDEVDSIKQSVAELDDLIAKARSIASAAAKSNDVEAIKLYGGRVNELERRRAQLTAGLNPLAKRSLGLQ